MLLCLVFEVLEPIENPLGEIQTNTFFLEIVHTFRPNHTQMLLVWIIYKQVLVNF